MVLPLRLLFFPALLLIPVFTSRADYFDDTGYRALAAELGAALPDGTGVSVTQVEFGDPDYLPQAGSGSFAGTGSYLAGKTFTAKSGASAASGHAFDVGAHFYSLNTNPSAGRASFAPGITTVTACSIKIQRRANSAMLAPCGTNKWIDSQQTNT